MTDMANGYFMTLRIWLRNAYSGQFGEFWGILTPEIVKLLF